MTLPGKTSDWTATPRWIPLTLVGALAIVAMSAVLGNRFAGDAIPLIVRNDHVHAISDFPMRVLETYWPQVTLESDGRLYRPLTSILFSFEWVLGVGSPLLYQATSLALYVLGSLLMFALARRFLPPGPATLAAALFAVHPVHVEAVASIAGQAELLGAALALLSATVYVDGIARGLTSTRLAVIVGGYALGCLALGQVVVLPLALLLITPFIPSARPSAVAREDASRALVALAATAVAYLAVRHTILGSLLGDAPHPAWAGTPASLRIMTMLSAVPVGLRLLFWPSRLQADYSPQEIELASGFGEGQVIGLVLVMLFGLAIWWSWLRAKPVAAGLLWIVVAILPTANLLAPTSVILSEASLFLPSIGACLIAGGLAAEMGSSRLASIPGLREALGGIALVLLAVSASFSGRRATVWYDTSTLHAQTVLDAPLSYRAWQDWGSELVNQGKDTEGAGAKLRSLSLFDRDPSVYDDLATIQRRLGRCDRAVPLYRVALAFDPDRYSTGVRLVGCLITLGDFTGAREEISLLSARGRPEYAGLETMLQETQPDSIGGGDSTLVR